MTRNLRQLKILELISRTDIETQDELAAELLHAGFEVTQATISRDIKELGLIKIPGENKKQKYAREPADFNIANKIVNMFRHAVVSIDSAENIVVIKTLSGGGGSAGMMIDRLRDHNVLGCVAGDDTVMIVVRSKQAAASLVAALEEILNG